MAANHGVLHRERLLALGLTASAISRRVRAGRLFRVAANVYALLPPTTRESWWMAAVLTSGPGAVLSHESASALYGGDRIARRVAAPGPGIHVTATRRSVAAPFVTLHRAGTLDVRDASTHRGIPVTSIERTIVDMGSMRSEHQLADLVHELTIRYDVHIAYVEALAERRRSGWHHAETVLGALALITSGVRGTRSELEDRFLEMLDAAGIRRPRMNIKVRIDGQNWEQDAIWEDAGLVIELDGRRTHGRPRNVRDDRLKDEALGSIGRRVMRLRWIDVTQRRSATVRRIQAALVPARTA